MTEPQRIDATHAEEAVNRVAAFFEVLDARPADELSEATHALRTGLGLDVDGFRSLIFGGGELLSKATPRTADELRALKAAVALGIYLGLTAEQLASEGVVSPSRT